METRGLKLLILKLIETIGPSKQIEMYYIKINIKLPHLMLPYDELPPTMEGILREPRIMPAKDPEAPVGFVQP